MYTSGNIKKGVNDLRSLDIANIPDIGNIWGKGLQEMMTPQSSV
jgi:hypothetical protein